LERKGVSCRIVVNLVVYPAHGIYKHSPEYSNFVISRRFGEHSYWLVFERIEGMSMRKGTVHINHFARRTFWRCRPEWHETLPRLWRVYRLL